MPASFKVAAIRLEEREKVLVRGVLAVSRQRNPSFEPYVNGHGIHPDIVLVNVDNAAGLQAWEDYRKQIGNRNLAAIMLTGQADTSAYRYVLQRPMAGRKLLALLEKVVGEVHGFSPTPAFDALGPDAAAPVHSGNGKSVRALVVDDSLPVRIQMKNALQNFASCVDFAESGEEAFALLDKSRYDIVFLDVVLPGDYNGYQICKAIKEMPEQRKAPVIMLTSNSSPADRIKGKMAGCDTYLVKPVNPTLFEQVVTTLIKPE